MFVDAISHITVAHGLLRIDARAVTGPGSQVLAGLLLIPLPIAGAVVRSLKETVGRAEATRRQADAPAPTPEEAPAQAEGSPGPEPRSGGQRVTAKLAEPGDPPMPAGDGTVLVEDIKTLSLSGGVYRLDCYARGGDGKSRLSGALMIPEERMPSLIRALDTMLGRLSRKTEDTDGDTTDLATIETLGSA